MGTHIHWVGDTRVRFALCINPHIAIPIVTKVEMEFITDTLRIFISSFQFYCNLFHLILVRISLDIACKIFTHKFLDLVGWRFISCCQTPTYPTPINKSCHNYLFPVVINFLEQDIALVKVSVLLVSENHCHCSTET